MLKLLFQLWGGIGYLLNKFFFSKFERAAMPQEKQQWRIRAWIVYLLGVPPWVFIFISERNWIAAAVESSGVPAMLMGLIAASRGNEQSDKHRWLDHLAKLMIVVGLGLSLYDFGGLTTFNQVIELGIAAGFLLSR